jgi:hypothetical protein
MKSRAEAAQNLTARLAASGVAGQMRAGDTLGLWTFNEELYSGRFPLQDWTPQSSQTIAKRVFEFISEQPFEKESRWAKVWPDLKEVVASSAYITVILVSDGTTKIQGTPFDDRINANYAEWQEQQKKASMPFVTVLRAQAGHFTNFVVNTPPFQLEMPPLPEEILHPKIVEPPKTAPAKQPVILPPLVLSGKKHEPVQPPPVAEVPTNQPVISKPVETPVNVASNPPVVETAKPPAPVIQEPVTNSAALAVSKPADAKPAVTPSATPAANSHNWILVVAVALAVTCLVILLVLVRRSRRRHVSLITRSLDREQR